MRRNMQQVLERWGGWAVAEENCSCVNWQPIAAGFRGLIPQHRSLRPSCCDNDGLIIDGCIARLSTVATPEDMLIICQRFIAGSSLRQIAEAMETSVQTVRSSLSASEAFITGCFAMLGVQLDMDYEVTESKVVVCAQKPVLY